VEVAQRPLDFTVRVPGSKSIANRALVCGALARGKSTLYGLPDGDDTSALVVALRTLGAQIVHDVDGSSFEMEIREPIDLEDGRELRLHARLAGTTSRFLTAIAALRRGATLVDGDEPLRTRPIGDLLDALGDLGAVIEYRGMQRALPLEIRRGGMSGGAIAVPGSVSSQFISALTMIGPLLEGGLRIDITGDLVSSGYVDMTLSVMREFGVRGSRQTNTILVDQGQYVGTNFAVDPDASSATYPAAAVALVGGTVRLVDLARSGTQPDSRFPALLEQMGCSVSVDGDDICLSRDPDANLRGISVDMREMSDAVPTLAVVAASASTPTAITGVGFIRAKESNRLADLAHELRTLGSDVVETHDGLRIHPAQLVGNCVSTHHDHRLAMALGTLGLAVPGVVVEDPSVVSKSWPTFWTELERWAS
jgi:3-phosphoshikimate 1-carboxyvinyltransferase